MKINKPGGIKQPANTQNLDQTNQAQQAPATQPAPQATPAGGTQAADGFTNETGTADGAMEADAGAALPRSGWGDESALRGAVNRARQTLDAEVADAGNVNFRTPIEGIEDFIGRPDIMPMYGMPVPDELLAQPWDQALREAFKGMLDDGIIDEVEAKTLVKATDDGNVMTATERQDLGRILNNLPHKLTENAAHILDDALKSTDQGLDLKSGAIRDGLRGMMSDFKIDAREVTRLIAAAMDEVNGGPASKLTDSQKSDLLSIRDNLRTTKLAAQRLTAAAADEPTIDPIDDPIIAPMYGIAMPDLLEPLKDRGIRQVWESAWADRHIDVADANAIIKEAKDNGGLSKREKDDFNNILTSLGTWMEPEARTKLQTYLGAAPDETTWDPIIAPMYGMPAPDLPPVDIDPPDVRPMYGMPIDIDDPGVRPDPIIRPMYGVAMPIGLMGGADD